MEDQSKWLNTASFPALAEDDVHVWRIRLDAVDVLSGVSTLSVDERQRAEGFHFEKDRINYSRTRGMLRHLLGRYLDVPPRGIPIDYQMEGKPFVRNDRDLRFNVSHSGGVALIA